MSFDTTQLENLSEKELRSLSEKISLLIELKFKKENPEVEKSASDIELFYCIIIEALFKRTGQKYPDLPILKQKIKTQYKLVKEAYIYTNTYICNLLKTKKVHNDILLKISEYYALLSIKYLEENSIPISLQTVLSIKTLFPSLFEAQFPDYIESGFADIIFSTSPSSLRRNK